MRYLAVDPGMATGMAVINDDLSGFETWQVDDPWDVANTVDQMCSGRWYGAHELAGVAIEDFHLRLGGRAMTVAGIRATLELIGAVRYITEKHGVPQYMQWPEDAREFSTNDKLKKMGWATPSKPDHRRSAARHLLLFLVREGVVPGSSLL